MDLSTYIRNIYHVLPMLSKDSLPWDIITDLENLITKLLPVLAAKNYRVENQVAIHESALVENGVTFNPKTIIGPRCKIRSGSYFRNGIYLLSDVVIGANSEIKQSIMFKNSSAAHLNYIGNSIVGENVNFEAGSVLANHFNEREDKTISVLIGNKTVETKVTKFGSLVGDHSRIGANSVLNPGSILPAKSIVPRLTHIDQLQ